MHTECTQNTAELSSSSSSRQTLLGKLTTRKEHTRLCRFDAEATSRLPFRNRFNTVRITTDGQRLDRVVILRHI